MTGRGAEQPAEETAADLLSWFERRDRDVPGRDDEDPYRIWVREVMAQQTRIQTVRERLPAFLEAYPTLEALSRSDPDELMRAWEGLGYYARARNLRLAASQIVEGSLGPARLPTTVDELRALPGVGPYTAGAVASIAFGRPEPAIDGNARRVLSRLFDIENPTARALDERGRELIAAADGPGADPAGSKAGLLNQAIMDLGGEVCTPRSPDCDGCPVSRHCKALALGTVADRPPRKHRAELPHHDIAVALIWRGDRVLIQRRPDEGLLGGLWEFPGGKVEAGEAPGETAVRETLEETGLAVRITGPAGRVDHAYSHFRITLHAFHAEPVSEGAPIVRSEPSAWVTREELARYAFPAANRRILASLGEYPA